MGLRRLKSSFGRRVARLIGGRTLLKAAKTQRGVKTKLRQKRQAIETRKKDLKEARKIKLKPRSPKSNVNYQMKRYSGG